MTGTLEHAATPPRARRRAPLTLLIVVALVAAVLTSLHRHPSTKSATPAGNDKTACLYTQHDVNQLQQIQTAFGRTYNCAVLFNDVAETWAQWERPWFDHAPSGQPQFQWPDWVRQGDGAHFVVVTQAMVPKNVPADWRTRGAAGEYDGYIRALGADLVSSGLSHSIIRLGHEANGTWYHDNIGNTPADYKAWAAYWAHFSAVLKSVPGNHFQLDWTIMAGYRAVTFSQYYPGDGAVDIIGVDAYDTAADGKRDQPARWKEMYSQPGGIAALLNFAAQHHKIASIPEWGLVASSKHEGAGDDPYYINQMADLIKRTPIRYENYFETEPKTGIFGQAPESKAAYLARFGPQGDVRGP
jgi:hypothetical protein